MLIGVRLLPRRQPAECKADSHRFGAPQLVGPSILRRICIQCSHVSIDLTARDEPPDPALFTDRPGTGRARQ
jgi:hypothetical protein